MKKQKPMFRFTLFIFLALVFLSTAGPAGAEEGYLLQILDPNGMPVEGARIEVEGADVTVQTDTNGKARIAVVPGTYNIEISAKGFEPLAQNLRIKADQAEEEPIRMSLAFTTDDVVVTGTMTGRLLDDTPVKTELVTREDIERKTAISLAGALSQVEGVRVEANCQNCGFTGVRINGLDSKYTQILMDSMPVVSGLASVYGLEQIPQEMIERVEVVKGGGSALYGGNAVAGVINVISRRPTRNQASVSGNYLLIDMDQPWLNISASGSVVNEERDMGAFVFGGTQYRNAWDANDDGFSEIGRLRLLDAGANVFFDPFDDASLQINTHFIQEKRRGGDSFEKPEHQAEIAESINTRRYGADMRWKHWLSSSLNYEVNYGFAYTERDSYYGAGMDPNAYGFTKNPVHVVRGALNNNFSEMGRYGSLLLTAGLQYEYEELKDTFPSYDRFTDVDYSDFGGFIQADWLVNDWIEPIVGVRVDKHSEIDDPIASPRLALKIKPTDRVTLRTSASTGFRAPQIFDEDLHITIVGGEPTLIENSPDLKEESSYSFSQEVATDWVLPDTGTFRFAVTGFYTRINDTFTFEEIETPGALVLRRINQGHTEVYGAEFQMNFNCRDWLTADFGWTLESAKRSEPDPIFNSDDVFRTPEAYGFLATIVRPMDRLEIINSLELTGPMKVEHFAGFIPEDRLEESDWFYVWDSKVSYTFDLKHNRNLKVYVGVDNILDSFQDDFDEGPDRDAGYVYGPMVPRTFVTGFKFGI